MNPNLVLFHASCSDGFAAAWLLHVAYPDAEFKAVQYGEDPPDVAGKHVWIVDFSFKRPILLAMKQDALSLLVLDHHATAKDDLAGLDFCRFDMDQSGARLTWVMLWTHGPHEFRERFRGCSGLDAPWLVNYTEDRDLWRHKLPNSKAINATLRTYPMDFAVWDALDKRLPSDEMAEEGVAILRYQAKLVETHVGHAEEKVILGHKVLAVNCTCADLTSEVAGELAKDRPFGVCYFVQGDSRIYSLRSREGGLDVSEIAKQFDGGGHRNAAGFKVLDVSRPAHFKP